MNGLIDFINRNYIEGIISDTSYNHFDMITYVIILFAGVYAVLKLLNKLRIKVDEEFVIATIPYIFMGSVFRVIEDADLLKPPVKYFFITPIIFFVIFAICFGALLLTRYLGKIRKIRNYIRAYAITGVILIPLSLILVLVIVLLLERDSSDDQDKGEKYMLTLTLIVLGFSMGARNLLAMVFGV